MDGFELLVDLHLDGTRQGPGGDDETRRAVDLSGLRDARDLRIADIGCGTGASTMVLASELDAHVVAVDLVPEFLARLAGEARHRGFGTRVTTLAAPMDDLPFDDGAFDAIWSEGAIYIVGFEAGVRAWRRFLKPNGVLAVSELTWLTGTRPAELDRHWATEYPEVGTAAAKLAVLEANGFSPIGYFVLPQRCWLDQYYRPLQARFDAFLERHGHAAAAREIVDAEQREIDLYERYADHVSYGYYVARRTAD
ncbi:MAG: class I SAM-dependent methyltransferase [Ilumatobacteraceae bacterium]